MKDNMDQLLKIALAPTNAPDEQLNCQVLRETKEREVMAAKKMKKRFPAAVVLAACIFVLGSITAVAAYRYLSPAQAASETGDDALENAFLSEEAVFVNETQESGGYRVTLLGSVAGKNISRYIPGDGNGIPKEDRIYTVVAIEHADGTPMPDISSDEAIREAFFVSHYIQGLDPARYSMMSMGGGTRSFVKDGVLYTLMEMDNIEIFADRGIYVGVSSGSFYDGEAYYYEESTGVIKCNESYPGVNALFVLPVDKSKADPEAAEKCLEEYERSLYEPSEPVEMDEKEMEADAFVNMLTSENIDDYCTALEAAKQVCIPDKDGYVSFNFELEDGTSGNGTMPVDEIFPDGKTGIRQIKGMLYAGNGEGLADLLIEVFTLNEDGTVTYEVYQPRL